MLLLNVVIGILVVIHINNDYTLATDCQSVDEYETGDLYYVHPDGDNTSCPEGNQTCENLTFYADNKEDYFQSSSTFHFLDGIFSHNSIFIVENITDLRMVGQKENSTIDCSGSRYAGFAFINVSRLHIENLKMYNCGQDVKFGWRYIHAALGCRDGINHTILNVDISFSHSQNIYYDNVRGNVRICGSRFAHTANTKNHCLAGNAFFFSECISQDVDFLIEYSVFHNNTIKRNNSDWHCHKSFASGLLIVLKCTNVAVTVDNTHLDQNEAHSGGNMAIVFHNITQVFASPVHIKNSNITNGRADVGAGIFTTLVEASEKMNETCTPTFQARPLLNLTNITFAGNEAKVGGGGLYLRPKESQTYCSVGQITIRNCTFRNNTVYHVGPGGAAIHNTNYIALGYLQHAVPQFHLIIVDTEFLEHWVKSSSGKGVIFVKASPHVSLENVFIHNNTCSGILGVSSSFIISGNVTIFNNSASSGGGMMFCSDSVMFLTPYTNLTIKNNTVEHAGGGICIEMLCLQSRPMCFFQLDFHTLLNYSLIDTINVSLENNQANYSGHEIYGGSVEYCYLLDSPTHDGRANKSKPVFKKLFNYTPKLSSSVSSPPQRVCECNNSNQTICDKRSIHVEKYPGETFKLFLVIVGQFDGTVPGTIEAKFEHHELHNPDNNYSFNLRHGEPFQSINRTTCKQISYTVFTQAEQATLVLRVGIIGDASFVEHLKEFKKLEVNVTLRECPKGFQLGQGKYGYCCQCLKALHDTNHHIECDITSKTITTANNRQPLWIGYSNGTYLISKSLAFDYCWSNDSIVINVTDESIDQDVQCQNHRTGILCGACPQNYSIILGSSECQIDCTNRYLSLVLVFAIAGILLVIVLSFLNLTVAEGTLNGLIFYANIVQIHRSTFFQYHPIRGLTTSLLLFVSWINLDFGIPVCFYKGMDEYVKAWLQFLFPVYVWMLSGIIILLSRRFSSFAKLFGSNGVKVLATLILLSYTKMLRAIIATFHSQVIEHYYINEYNYVGNDFVFHWKPDANILYLRGKHIPLFIAGVVFGLLCLPFTFTLLCIQNLQKVSNRRCFTWVARLKPFFDAFTGPYSKRARFWTGLLLLMRCILYSISATNYSNVDVTNIFLTVFACTILFVIAWMLQPGIYEKKSLDWLECSYLLNLSILCTGTAFTVYDERRSINSAIAHMSVLVAYVTFLGILFYHGFKQIKRYVKMRKNRSSTNREVTVTVNVTTTEVTTNNCSPAVESALAKFPPFVSFNEDREPLLAPDDDDEHDNTVTVIN